MHETEEFARINSDDGASGSMNVQGMFIELVVVPALLK
jgi:hypothetical protein